MTIDILALAYKHMDLGASDPGLIEFANAIIERCAALADGHAEECRAEMTKWEFQDKERNGWAAETTAAVLIADAIRSMKAPTP